MNIQRDTEYRFGELVQAPEYLNKQSQPKSDFVDFGLPSGTLWARNNLGAENETDAGLYFAWGETTGYTAEQIGTLRSFDWESYEFSGKSCGGLCAVQYTKYNSDDRKLVLDPSDDAATVMLGGDWCIPNCYQYTELMSHTIQASVDSNGIAQFGQSYVFDTNGKFNNKPGKLFVKSSIFSQESTDIQKQMDFDQALQEGEYLWFPLGGYADQGCGGAQVNTVDVTGRYITSQLPLPNHPNNNILNILDHNNLNPALIQNQRYIGVNIRPVIGRIELDGCGQPVGLDACGYPLN